MGASTLDDEIAALKAGLVTTTPVVRVPAGPPPPPPPAAAPARGPAQAPLDDDIGRPITPEEAARYGATPREAALAAQGPTPGYETWEQKQAREATMGSAPDVRPASAPAGPAATQAPALGNRYAAGAAGPGTEGASASTPLVMPRIGTATIPAHEVAAVAPARQAALLGAMNREGMAAEGAAEAAAGVEGAKATGSRDMVQAYADAGESAKQRAKDAADESRAFRSRIDEFSAKLANDKIDPNGMYHSASTGTNIMWTLAKALGAVGQAYLKLPTNQIADHIDAMARADVAAQRENHEMGRERLGDMKSMYAEALKATGNADEAERLAVGYALKAAEQNAQALTQDATGKAQKAKGEEIVAALGTRAVDTQIKMNPLVQAKAAGPDMQKVYALARERVKEQEAQGHPTDGLTALKWAMAMSGSAPIGLAEAGGAKDGGGGEMTREQRGKIAMEREQATTASVQFNKLVDSLKSHPVITGSGMTEAALSNLPQRVAPESNDAQQQLEAINTQMLQAIGKVAKDADGKPNKVMIDKLEKRFEIHLGDSPRMKQQKLTGSRDAVNALARGEGVDIKDTAAGLPSYAEKP